MLGEEFAFPEEVDAVLAFDGLDALLEAGDLAALHAEDVEEVVPEGLRLGVFSGLFAPLAGELDGALADFSPGKRRHGPVITVMQAGGANQNGGGGLG